jgi:hypothetical protein
MNSGTTVKHSEDLARAGLGDDGERDVLARRLADVGHTLDNRKYETRDTSWHSSHHARPALVRTGRRWWQSDLAGKFIRQLDRVSSGLPWRSKRPPLRNHVGMSSPDADHDTPRSTGQGSCRVTGRPTQARR